MFESAYECYNMGNAKRNDMVKYTGHMRKKEKTGKGKLQLLLAALIQR
jgi:hypothetical protein